MYKYLIDRRYVATLGQYMTLTYEPFTLEAAEEKGQVWCVLDMDPERFQKVYGRIQCFFLSKEEYKKDRSLRAFLTEEESENNRFYMAARMFAEPPMAANGQPVSFYGIQPEKFLAYEEVPE